MKTQGWGVGTIASCGFGVLAVWFVACAGADTPPVDDNLRGALATGYGGADTQMGTAGAAGAGNGSSGAAGAGGGNGSGGNGSPAGGAAGAGGEPSGGGNGGNGGGGNGAGCDAYNTVFLAKCAGSSCHGDGALNGVFAGENEPTPADLVDVPSRNGDACGVLVDSSNVEDSVILLMLTGEQGPTCSPVPMPLGNDDLPPDEIECVTEYLQALVD